MQVITNNVPREILTWFDLTEKERAEFDYFKPEEEVGSFFRYKGEVYDLNDGFELAPSALAKLGWDQYQPDSFFSGLVARPVEGDDWDTVIVVGRYCT